jgi:hypothetical protein
MSAEDKARAQLFSVRLQDFTKERNKAAKEHPALKTLPKPKPSAWALNQLARSQRAKVEAFFKNARRLQHPPKDRKLPPDAWKKAVADIRDQTERLVDEAVSALDKENLSATRRTRDEIAMSLRAAALDEDFGEELLKGQLLEPRLESFGLVAGPARIPTRAKEPAAEPDRKTEKAPSAEEIRLQRKREALEKKAHEAHVAVVNAERALKRAEESLRAAKDDHQAIRRSLAELKD